MEAHTLRRTVIRHEQIHANPIGSTFFIDGEAERTERGTLHADFINRAIVRRERERTRQGRECSSVFIGDEHCVRSRRRLRLVANRRKHFVIHNPYVIGPPVLPTDDGYDRSRCGQSPCGDDAGAAIELMGTLLRAKFLQEAHLNSGGSFGLASGVGKHGQLQTSRFPGIGESGTTRASGCVCGGRCFFLGTDASSAGVETHCFEFFTLHTQQSLGLWWPLAIPLLKVLNCLPKRDAERRAKVRVAPSIERGRDEAASGWCRWDNRSFALPLRN